MKKKKLLSIGLACLMTAAIFIQGCSVKELPVNEYTCENGMFTISLPGEWKEDDNMGAPSMLSLTREDGISALALGMTKAQTNGETLEGFQGIIEETMINGAFATSKITEAEPINMPDMKNSISSEVAATDTDGAKGKIFIAYMESEKAYYSVMLSSDSGRLNDLEPVKKKMLFKELEMKDAASDISDTLRWFNTTYAILTKANGGNVNLVSGFEPGDAMKSSMVETLKRDWDITDRASLDKQIKSLISGGHNADSLNYLKEEKIEGMTRKELIAAMKDSGFNQEEKTIMLAAFDAQKKYGKNAIKAWDQSRAMQLLGYGYLAGYCTYEEAMDKSVEIAGKIQKTFTSWDDFVKSYFYGYEYWSGESLKDADSQASKRWKIYEELKAEENSIYNLDWNLKFVKDWK